MSLNVFNCLSSDPNPLVSVENSDMAAKNDKPRPPSECKIPNAKTRATTGELEAGQGQCFSSIEALLEYLYAEIGSPSSFKHNDKSVMDIAA